MLIYPEKFLDGYNEIINLNGNGKKMLMDVGVLMLPAGDSFDLLEKEKETALLLLDGEVEFLLDGKTYTAKRKSLFDDLPSCLHIPLNTSIQVKALAPCEIYVQKTKNERLFLPVFYSQNDIHVQKAGFGDVLQGCMRRNIHTVFDYSNAPYSNMVLGEVLNFPGRWSSYPPHHHPQPEVYFYKFDKPQGFGGSFIGDEVYRIFHNSLAMISDNVCHPQSAAPGYAMYYVWGIRHLDGDPWIKTRIDAPEHTWLLAPDAQIWNEK
jgi:5-deoxy-glucuronate isomerase